MLNLRISDSFFELSRSAMFVVFFVIASPISDFSRSVGSYFMRASAGVSGDEDIAYDVSNSVYTNCAKCAVAAASLPPKCVSVSSYPA